jgi:hypothetical protein
MGETRHQKLRAGKIRSLYAKICQGKRAERWIWEKITLLIPCSFKIGTNFFL